MLEALEGRILLSAKLAGGLLTINGTARNDTISTRLSGPYLVVSFNGVESRVRASGVSRICINGKGGDDFIANGADGIPVVLNGGAGDDVLSGGLGDDTLFGGPGDDRLFGQGGDDLLDGGAGDDIMVGGTGEDAVSYASRLRPVTVFMDGSGPSGEAGEHDSISGVENVRGGAGDDTIHGAADTRAIWGGPGNDTIDGGEKVFGDGGDDLIITDPDEPPTTIDGGAGNDTAVYDAKPGIVLGIESIESGVEFAKAMARKL